jgi:UDP-3-O-[3-hydroxymyristoyl] N-acetylglucosamine deacetylase
MKHYGLAKGGSLDNAVLVASDGIVNPEGLRFADEFVRHKILDCIGDFSLLGMPILGHIVAEKSGHAFNHMFLNRFFVSKDAWETRTIQLSRPGRILSPTPSRPWSQADKTAALPRA